MIASNGGLSLWPHNVRFLIKLKYSRRTSELLMKVLDATQQYQE